MFQKVIKLELGHFNKEQDKEIKTIKANKTEVENKIKKVQVRWGLGEISHDIYDTTNAALQSELYKINNQLNSYSKKMSNLDNIAHGVSVITSKLGSLWKNSNYEDRVKLQNLLFPEGILWDKIKENYRTMKINKVFEVISLLPNVYNDKKERNDNESASLSPQVELTGVEPVSKRGSNMLSTCLSSPSVFVCQQDRSHQSAPYPLNVHLGCTANQNYSRFSYTSISNRFGNWHSGDVSFQHLSPE